MRFAEEQAIKAAVEKEYLFHQARQAQEANCQTAGQASGGIVGGLYTANECCDTPYRPPSTRERIEKEIVAHQHEAKRIAQLTELWNLLIKYPDVARILELKAELGL